MPAPPTPDGQTSSLDAALPRQSPTPAVSSESVIQHSSAKESAEYQVPDSSLPETTITITNQNVLPIWERVCQNLDDLTASNLESAESVAISVPNHLVVKFPSHYTFQKDACERPERRTKLEEELYRTTGNRVRVTFELLPEISQPKVVEQDSGVKTIRQRRREAEQHPMVQQAMETFGAEVVRVDHPRSRQ
jgi:DNA polymerase-3 subunit gamma/tau